MADGEIHELLALQNIVNGSRRVHAELRNTVPLRPRSRWYWMKVRWSNRARNVRDAWLVLRGKAGIE